MIYLVGMDEAGYGPLLGPLVISASVWRLERLPQGLDLYRRLKKVIVDAPAAGDERVAIADSKRLYKSGGDLKLLERALLPLLALTNRRPASWREVWTLLEALPSGELSSLPWHVDYSLPLPLALSPDEVDPLAETLRAGLRAAKVELVAIRSRAIFPERFNRLVSEHNSKGAALSCLTLQLLADLLSQLEPGPVVALCDKHGGRDRYNALLQQHFPEWLVEVHSEGREKSVYRWGPDDARVEVRFQPGGERYLPVALASMTCKYLRELAMNAFNHYWCSRLENLRPTAGYYNDALRFGKEIAALQNQLGIDDQLVWRCQ